jgi:hypothetical protein
MVPLADLLGCKELRPSDSPTERLRCGTQLPGARQQLPGFGHKVAESTANVD